MNSFPTRKETSFFADVILRYHNNDLFLFVEDEKNRPVYKKLVNRFYDNKIKIGKIYSLGSKDNVLKTFEEWNLKSYQLKKCVFLVDKDFDHFKGLTIPQHSNLIELEFYTIENYFVTKEAALSLLEVKCFDKEKYELEQILNWESWLESTYKDFKKLFIVYAIAHKYSIDKNCSESPYKYLMKADYQVNVQQVENYANMIKEKCEILSINFEQEFFVIDEYYVDNNSYKYESLIKGKFLLIAMFKYLHNISGEKFDEDLSLLIIADNILLNKLEFLKQKLMFLTN